jgi:uncharacterized protein (DUF1330 family)
MARGAVTLCVLLWARAGRDSDLGRYEDQVLALLADHDGRVVQRARVEGSGGQVEGGGQPAEVQILQFGSDEGLAGYMHDPRRTALAGQRDAAIARTDIFRATLHEQEADRSAG